MDVMVPDGLWIYVDNPFSIHISTEIPPSVARGPRPASVAPMNDYEPIPGVPVPSHCNLDTAALHVTVRTRSGRPHIRPLKSVPVIVHIWSHCTPQSLIHISNGVHALHAFHVWAQLSSYLSTEDLVVLGDSILAMLVRNGAPDADKLYLELQRFIKEMPPFRGKSICRQAMTLVRPNVWSPAESSLRLSVQRHGILDGRCNVVVPGITFRSGTAISLDIAWVEFKVGVEYDGDHHRTDKVQWRRDNEKKGTVAGPRLDINHRDRSKSD